MFESFLDWCITNNIKLTLLQVNAARDILSETTLLEFSDKATGLTFLFNTIERFIKQ